MVNKKAKTTRRKIVAKKSRQKIAIKPHAESTAALRAEIALLKQELAACRSYLDPQIAPLQPGECVTQTIGKRPYQEDRYVVTNITLPSLAKAKLWALFDGHGGAAVADILVKAFPRAIATALMSVATHVQGAIITACLNLDAQLKERAGSTAVAILLYNGTLYTINIGDSRALIRLATGTIIVTEDQKPIEGRIYNQNAFVVGGYLNIATKTGTASLGVGAAFGDVEYKDATGGAFNAMPVVNAYKLERAYNPVNAVLASDGLWDVVTSAEVAPMLQHPKPTLCQDLVKLATERGSTDNITVMVANNLAPQVY